MTHQRLAEILNSTRVQIEDESGRKISLSYKWLKSEPAQVKEDTTVQEFF